MISEIPRASTDWITRYAMFQSFKQPFVDHTLIKQMLHLADGSPLPPQHQASTRFDTQS